MQPAQAGRSQPAGLMVREEDRGVAGLPDRRMQGAPTLFQEQWWFDAASKGRFDQIEIVWDGKLVGSLPFVTSRHRGLRYFGMPPYTHTVGPIVDLPPSKPSTRRRNMRRLTHELVKRLPAHDHFLQALDPEDDGAFGFSLAGLRVAQRFTFRSSVGEDAAVRWKKADQKTRNLIKTAQTRFQIVETTDFDRFIALSRAEHLPGSNRHDFPLLETIFSRCLERDCGMVLLALRHDGSVAAAATLVWGRDTAYYWLSARDRSISAGGANALLLWNCMQFAHERGLRLDFDGYSSIAGARFLASFGEAPLVRPEISSTSWRYDMLTAGLNAGRRLLRTTRAVG